MVELTMRIEIMGGPHDGLLIEGIDGDITDMVIPFRYKKGAPESKHRYVVRQRMLPIAYAVRAYHEGIVEFCDDPVA